MLQKSGFLKRHKGLSVILSIAVIVLTVYSQSDSGGEKPAESPSVATAIEGDEYTVSEVIDGDTVALAGVDTTLRFLLIDTPEVGRAGSAADPFSQEAKNLTKTLIEGKRVTLEFDKEKFDHYGRMLAYVYSDGVFVNRELIKRGLAKVLVIKPNNKYEREMNEAEAEAKRVGKGIWANPATYQYPAENANYSITPSEAARYVNKRAVIRGKITAATKSPKVIRLSLEGEADIIIFSGDWDNFAHFGITPEEYYKGREVEVIGRVKIYRGVPQITAGHPIVLRIAN
ncbi:MAG: thermonuclease family protein [Deltaproteobacteria bacterium]